MFNKQSYIKIFMKEWLHKVELFVDAIIPYLVILLAIIIVIEIFFKRIAESYHLFFDILDYTIIAFFVIDLVFKWLRIRKFKKFLQMCWLDILAIFPFVLLFRVIEEAILLFRISEEIKDIQSVFHVAAELKKEAPAFLEESAKIAEEVEKSGRVSRTRLILRILKPLQRSPRLLKAVAFYEKPTGKHHLHEFDEEQ